MKSSNRCSSEDLKTSIRDRVKGRVAIAAIGNIMRGDDGLGPKFIEILKGKNLNAALFDCGSAPENYIFPILTASCDTVILIDAADMGIPPGTARVFNLNEISSVSFSTHNPSPRLFTDLLMTGKDNLNIFVVSVQPKDNSLGGTLTKEVLSGLNMLADTFLKAIA